MTERKDARRRLAAVLEDELSDRWTVLHHDQKPVEGGYYVQIHTGAATIEQRSQQLFYSQVTFDIDVVTVPTTSGQPGEVADVMDDAIDEVEQALIRSFCSDKGNGEFLYVPGHATYDEPPDWLGEEAATLLSNQGDSVKEDGGGVMRAASRFQIRVPILREVEHYGS